MSDDVKVGDSVEWSSSGGKSVGRVKKKLTKPMDIKGHHVAASPDNPEYLVESDSGGGQAAHKPASLKKASSAKKAVAGTKSAASPAKKTSTEKSTKKTTSKSAPKKATAKKSPKR